MRSLIQVVPALILAIASMVVGSYGPGAQGNQFNLAGGIYSAMLILAPTIGELSAAGGGSSTQMLIRPPGAPASQKTVTIVTNRDGTFAFSPATLTVPKNTAVTWKNTTSVSHTATSDDGTTFDSGTIPSGSSFTFVFTQAGTYSYHCNFHPYMTGTITVQEAKHRPNDKYISQRGKRGVER
jgi:plastocyanin